MRTKCLTSTQLSEAVALLEAGKLVAVPTETVYGLAADATQAEAVRAIYTAKGRAEVHYILQQTYY